MVTIKRKSFSTKTAISCVLKQSHIQSIHHQLLSWDLTILSYFLLCSCWQRVIIPTATRGLSPMIVDIYHYWTFTGTANAVIFLGNPISSGYILLLSFRYSGYSDWQRCWWAVNSSTSPHSNWLVWDKASVILYSMPISLADSFLVLFLGFFFICFQDDPILFQVKIEIKQFRLFKRK